ncbi:A24 family peptidase [Evansella sp. AB-rgal1]|uniref:prepilin peptidase n=1 Tax=Evansella sp. AB-rgal1 TaxID=3242696 RepID=UPI00359ED0F3
MELTLHIYLFILGAILGSFYNVVGLRVPAGESIVSPGSHCPACNKNLTWMELIPILSFFLQKGRCRNCATKISPVYPFYEALTACLFTISPLLVGWSKELPIALALISLLIIITVSDLSTMLIPDKVLLFFLPLFILLTVISPLTPWWDSIVGAVVGFGILLLIAIVSKGGMGGGDIKLFGVLGIVLGLTGVFVALFIASFLGAVVGIAARMGKKVEKGSPIPFGPFIAIGSLISYFFHNSIIEWYIQLLF